MFDSLITLLASFDDRKRLCSQGTSLYESEFYTRFPSKRMSFSSNLVSHPSLRRNVVLRWIHI